MVKVVKGLTLSILASWCFVSGQAMANNESTTDKCHATTTLTTKADANNTFDSIEYQNSLVGYGATTDKKAEITIMDGQLYLVSYENGQYQTRTQPNKGEGVVMLIQAKDFSWNEGMQISDVGSKDDFNFVLEDAIEENGCSGSAPIPFKLIGEVSLVDWSVVNGAQPHVHRVDKNVKVEINGLYTANNKDQFKMMKGYSFHAHMVIKDQNLAGHIHDISLKEGATLYLPK